MFLLKNPIQLGDKLPLIILAVLLISPILFAGITNIINALKARD